MGIYHLVDCEIQVWIALVELLMACGWEEKLRIYALGVAFHWALAGV